MIKRKDDKKVDEWEDHKSGFSTTIYLRYTSFVATLLEKSFEAPDIAMLRKQLSDYAEHWITMEWFPILELQASETSHYSDRPDASVQLKFKRFLMSQSPAGEMFTVDWDVHPDHRKAEMSQIDNGYRSRGRGMGSKLKLIKFPLVAPLSQGSDNCFWISYTDELWGKCEYIAGAIQSLREQLNDMIKSNEGIQKLLAIGGPQTLQLMDVKVVPSKKKGK